MDPGRCERRSFLSPTGENERISAFEPDDGLALPCLLYEEFVDVILGHNGLTSGFRHADLFRSDRSEFKQRTNRKPVKDHNIGHGQGLSPTQGQ